MTDTVIEPITASADGKRNAYTHACRVVQQKMSYAACLNRVAAVDSGTYPRDWAACAGGMCAARDMRQQELVAGKAIFFAQRSTIGTVYEGARTWVSNVGKAVKNAVTTSAPSAPPAAKPKDALDAIGSLGSYADAINAHTVAAPAEEPKTVTVTKPLQAPPQLLSSTVAGLHPQNAAAYVRATMLPGETPLQMALRMKKEREASNA